MKSYNLVTYRNNSIQIPKATIQPLSWPEFHEVVGYLLRDRFRLVSFFASPDKASSQVNLNVVLVDRFGGLILLRTVRDTGGTFPTLTHEHPSFHCFEREIYEQCNLKPVGHPWLKPTRFSGSNLGKMQSYPFFKLEGKEVHEVGVGPIHAGVIEPGHFRFMCFGETVHHLEIQLGYQHRGLEDLLLKKDPLRLAPLIETAAGDTSIAHTWAYTEALEKLCQFQAPTEINFVRGIALELERIAMHLAGLAGISTDIAFLPGGSTYGRLRTAIINSTMRICGSRFGRSWIRPGGTYFGFNPDLSSEISSTLKVFQKEIKIINDLFINSRVVQHRLKGIGIVTRDVATQLGLVGVAARASGLPIDIRGNLSVSPYSKLGIGLAVQRSGDCWARSIIRIREIENSTKWILSVLEKHPKLPSSMAPLQLPAANSIAMSIIEGWRGEVFHYLETGDDGEIIQYRIQDPSLRNWFGMALAVRDNPISDFPICNKSFDLSYCGHDL